MALFSYSPTATPIAVITSLSGEIISTTKTSSSVNSWVIQKSKTIITRFWSAAQCEFSLVCNSVDSHSSLLYLPSFYKIEREFCLWHGYISDGEVYQITSEMLGKNLRRVFIGVLETISRVGSDQGGISVNFSARDRMKWLMDTTVTFNPYRKEDKVSADVSNVGGKSSSGTEKGIPRSEIILEVARRGIGQTDLTQCVHCGKDIVSSSSFFYDKALTSGDMPEPDSWYVSADFSTSSAQLVKDLTVKLQAAKLEFDKKAVLYTQKQTEYDRLKNNSSGLNRLENQLNQAKSEYEDAKDLYQEINGQLYRIQEQDQLYKINASKVSGKLTGPLGGNPPIQVSVNENPEFRIFTTRPAINLQEKGDFLIDDKKPAELVKFFAMQEVYPTELFQDSRDGNLYYAPRMADSSGLSDSERFYRTYYFGIPDTILSTLPNTLTDYRRYNQKLIRFKEEETSIGLKTNFIVKGSNLYSKNSSSAFNVHLRVKPYALKEEKFACKVSTYNDETISSLEEAVVVAFNVARLFGRETRAATGVLIGDPSIVPGEICQVSSLWSVDDYQKLPSFLKEERDAYLGSQSVLSKAKALIKDFDSKLADPKNEEFEVDLPMGEKLKGKALDQKDEQLEDPETILCKDTSKVYSDNRVGFNREPSSIWRTEAVIHNFNHTGQGYTTEVAWSSPL